MVNQLSVHHHTICLITSLCLGLYFDTSLYRREYIIFLKVLFIYFWRGEEREKERERNIHVWLPLVHPHLGTWPATQACALTGNQTVTLWFAGRHSIH